jgi:hypothetical protein
MELGFWIMFGLFLLSMPLSFFLGFSVCAKRIPKVIASLDNEELQALASKVSTERGEA